MPLRSSGEREVTSGKIPGECTDEESLDVPSGYFPLPTPRNPWFLLPVDDAGPVYYFITHVLSSRFKKRRLLIALLRITARLGLYRLWPLVAPFLMQVVRARTGDK